MKIGILREGCPVCRQPVSIIRQWLGAMLQTRWHCAGCGAELRFVKQRLGQVRDIMAFFLLLAVVTKPFWGQSLAFPRPVWVWAMGIIIADLLLALRGNTVIEA
jgi:uncharacterized protein (DUF983 family)